MSAGHFLNRIQTVVTPVIRVAALACGLVIVSAQALTTSRTFNLGTSPASTNFPNTGINSLFVWIEKGSPPTGAVNLTAPQVGGKFFVQVRAVPTP